MKLSESMEFESAHGDLNANVEKKTKNKKQKEKPFLPRQQMVL